MQSCVRVRILCHGYQLYVCCAVPNEHIRLGVCQRLSVTSCRLVYSDWQEQGRVGDEHTHTRKEGNTGTHTYVQTDTSFVSFPSRLFCCPSGLDKGIYYV